MGKAIKNLRLDTENSSGEPNDIPSGEATVLTPQPVDLAATSAGKVHVVPGADLWQKPHPVTAAAKFGNRMDFLAAPFSSSKCSR